MSGYQPVVIDNGGGVLKAGVAGEERPKVTFRSMVGRHKHKRVMAGGALESDVYVQLAVLWGLNARKLLQ